jgi:hypothetical protein
MRIEPIALAPVDGVTITTLVDNVTDALLADDGRQSAPSSRLSRRARCCAPSTGSRRW